MIETEMDRLARRVESLYGQKQNTPNIPPLYFVPPPPPPKESELDQARALVIAFLKELPELMLLFVALGVVGIRRCWLWLRQWKRTPQVG
jgi:hypothetical protein